VGAGNLATAYCTFKGQMCQQYLSLKPYQINVGYYQFLKWWLLSFLSLWRAW